ncbi:MAG TPA: DUF1064 domain-containing protein [Ignavibacteriales bacterium]|nr:DUF1064 domain-containing protein [Ignavibacteriales bacterium]
MSRFSGWSEKNLAGLNIIQDGLSLANRHFDEIIAKPANKFGAVKTETGGIKYDSKMEANYAMQLEWRLRTGEISAYKGQVEIPLEVAGVHICNYIIDFVVTYPDGTSEYVEVKGHPTPAWRIKWKLFRALYPELKIKLVRKNDNKRQ